jgi:hypothetical protein
MISFNVVVRMKLRLVNFEACMLHAYRFNDESVQLGVLIMQMGKTKYFFAAIYKKGEYECI